MVVGIHQPNFLPWLGYFYKVMRSDRFVFLDNAQYTKNSFINRNRIRTQKGVQWLTVPVLAKGRFGQMITEVEMVWDTDWRHRHLQTLITTYGRAPFFHEVFAIFESSYHSINRKNTLADFNILLIQKVCDYLGVEASCVRASELEPGGQGTDLLVSLCRELGATAYLSGSGAAKYQDDSKFAAVGIEVRRSMFHAKPYSQLWGQFVENLSVIDAMMNCGQAARELITDTSARESEACVPLVEKNEQVR